MIWSTKSPHELGSVAHAMPEDFHGRPGGPLCGVNSHGLYFRREVDWAQVPNSSRCQECEQFLDSGG